MNKGVIRFFSLSLVALFLLITPFYNAFNINAYNQDQFGTVAFWQSLGFDTMYVDTQDFYITRYGTNSSRETYPFNGIQCNNINGGSITGSYDSCFLGSWVNGNILVPDKNSSMMLYAKHDKLFPVDFMRVRDSSKLHHSTYSNDSYVNFLRSYDEYYISFFTTRQVNQGQLEFRSYYGYTDYEYQSILYQTYNFYDYNTEVNQLWFLYTWKINTKFHGDYVTFDFISFNSNTKIIPIYMGYKEFIPNDYKAVMGIPNSVDEIENLINNGTSESQQHVQAANDKNNDLSTTMGTYDNISQQYNNDLSTNLNAIDTNFNLNAVSGFVNGANWVKTQFDYISNYQPIRVVLTYSMILGLALLLIGKRAI